jgi:AAA domain-containing protein/UvrD-like helicase family protein
MSSPAVQLMPEKAVIVDEAGDAKLLITAGPGTGKTFTLVHRIEKLACDDGLGPGSEILVLSFSRSAVQELRRRVKEFPNASYVRAVTFDSFATRFLYEADPNLDLSQSDYDDRIRRVAAMLREMPQAREQLSHIRHVLVDELQDLVGVRAELMLEVLKACGHGFTLFGDPAQGIYDFQLSNEVMRQRGALYVYDNLRQQFASALKERRLEHNHRATTETSRLALWAGPELASSAPNYKSIRNRLQECVRHLDTSGDVCATAYTLYPYQGTTGILCRTNGQAMAVSRDLWNSDIKHVLRRSATDRVVPAWIGIVLRNAKSQIVTRTDFIEMWSESGELLSGYSPDLHPEDAWEILRRTTKGNGRQLDLVLLADKMRAGNLPDELTEIQRGEVVVSTVHRAKGLEFDRVFVGYDPSAEVLGGDSDEDAYISEGEEARVLFVALTRPRKDMFHMNPPFIKGLRKKGAGGRWVVNVRFGIFHSFEVRGDDFIRDQPAGGFAFKANVGELQAYLAKEVRPGDSVLLFKHVVNGAEHYVIDHRGRMIGVTSESFGANLYHTLKVKHDWQVRWPNRITGLRIEAVDTVVGSGTTGIENGLGTSNLWLRARIAGLGDLNF